MNLPGTDLAKHHHAPQFAVEDGLTTLYCYRE